MRSRSFRVADYRLDIASPQCLAHHMKFGYTVHVHSSTSVPRSSLPPARSDPTCLVRSPHRPPIRTPSVDISPKMCSTDSPPDAPSVRRLCSASGMLICPRPSPTLASGLTPLRPNAPRIQIQREPARLLLCIRHDSQYLDHFAHPTTGGVPTLRSVHCRSPASPPADSPASKIVYIRGAEQTSSPALPQSTPHIIIVARCATLRAAIVLGVLSLLCVAVWGARGVRREEVEDADADQLCAVSVGMDEHAHSGRNDSGGCRGGAGAAAARWGPGGRRAVARSSGSRYSVAVVLGGAVAAVRGGVGRAEVENLDLGKQCAVLVGMDEHARSGRVGGPQSPRGDSARTYEARALRAAPLVCREGGVGRWDVMVKVVEGRGRRVVDLSRFWRGYPPRTLAAPPRTDPSHERRARWLIHHGAEPVQSLSGQVQLSPFFVTKTHPALPGCF
ncbi:hypothetical protein C8J57DRAFT_1569297 [Mycena rebaudengoi]|nr:hypothetical protein C8J57DRAFT_1569297 [Mycena rebaudengoi]